MDKEQELDEEMQRLLALIDRLKAWRAKHDFEVALASPLWQDDTVQVIVHEGDLRFVREVV